MKPMNKIPLVIATLTLAWGFGFTSHAVVTQVANYQLGEPGSVGASAPYTPLVDSIGGDNNIFSYNASAPTALVTSGLAAPFSTAALSLSGNAGGGSTWYNSSFNGGTGLTTDWAFSIWLRPDLSTGTFLGATDGNGATQVGLRFWATNNGQSGTSLGGKVLSAGSPRLLMSNGSGFLGATTSTYTVGQWYQVELINYNGTVSYYLNGVFQDSAATSGKVNDIRLGAGYWAATGSNGAFDEMKVWTFDHTVDSFASVQAAMAIPEPSTWALVAIALVPLFLRRRLR
jgi:hypothetical protein